MPNPAEVFAAVAVVLAAAVATVAARTRDPVRQAVVLSALGLVLSVLFLLVQAPDVALSQLAVGAAITPLLILLTVRAIRRRAAQETEAPDSGKNPEGGRGSGGGG
ncbi:DUF4040 domain-containing protein [Streptomyces fradiae]